MVILAWKITTCSFLKSKFTIDTYLVDLQTNSPLVFFEEWLENGWNSCNLSIECLEAHFHLGLGIFDFILSSQKIFGALGKLVFVLQSFKIGKVKVKGHSLGRKILILEMAF